MARSTLHRYPGSGVCELLTPVTSSRNANVISQAYSSAGKVAQTGPQAAQPNVVEGSKRVLWPIALGDLPATARAIERVTQTSLAAGVV